MRFAIVAFASFAAGTAVFLACSSDSTTATPGGPTPDAGSSSGQTSSSSGGGEEDAGPKDSGLREPTTGCLIHCTDYQKAHKIVSVPRTDVASPANGVEWQTPEGAVDEDDKVATATLEDGQESAYLVATDFRFDVPDDKITWGIAVELKRQGAPDGGVRDAKIELVFDDPKQTAMQRSKLIEGPWPRVIVGTHHYGQEIDTWGIDLNPKDVRPSTFGTRIAARRQEGVTGQVIGRVDSLKVEVCYCNADGK